MRTIQQDLGYARTRMEHYQGVQAFSTPSAWIDGRVTYWAAEVARLEALATKAEAAALWKQQFGKQNDA